ncbi:MAG TPA: TolC family protein [Gemmatimonadaceae bacterium]|nr:TolC family protein [Gemmatimonadaceae bacterium]
MIARDVRSSPARPTPDRVWLRNAGDGAATLAPLFLATLMLLPQHHAVAQQGAVQRDTVRLGALQAAALDRDPRALQLDLLGSRSALRVASIDAERLPSLGATAQGQYQSDVPTVPFRVPGDASPPIPHDSYDAYVSAQQRLLDPGRAARRAVERAELAESRAGVRSSLFVVRERVNEAFFSALLLQSEYDEISAGIVALDERLQVAAARVGEGTALPGERAMIEAELLRRRQSLDALEYQRDAALAILGDLSGRSISGTSMLVAPELGDRVRQARAALNALRDRPEYAQFARTRDRLDRQEELVSAADQPRVSAFGRAGYGRPGLNPLGNDFDAYWLAGVRVEWMPWNWGTTDRRREEIAIQQRIVATEEAAFSEGIRRSALTRLAAIDRLEDTRATDDSIVSLREQILREARLRFDEGVITSAELVDRESELLAARLARVAHRVELDEARVRFLTLAGIEVR